MRRIWRSCSWRCCAAVRTVATGVWSKSRSRPSSVGAASPAAGTAATTTGREAALRAARSSVLALDAQLRGRGLSAKRQSPRVAPHIHVRLGVQDCALKTHSRVRLLRDFCAQKSRAQTRTCLRARHQIRRGVQLDLGVRHQADAARTARCALQRPGNRRGTLPVLGRGPAGLARQLPRQAQYSGLHWLHRQLACASAQAATVSSRRRR